MRVKVREVKKLGKYLELTAITKQDVVNLEEIVGEEMEKLPSTIGDILGIVMVPFSALKNGDV